VEEEVRYNFRLLYTALVGLSEEGIQKDEALTMAMHHNNILASMLRSCKCHKEGRDN
jgi:hypothetical protein